MDNGNNGAFSLVFDGTGKPGLLSYLVTGLKTGQAYRFKVRSVNFNGESADSTETLLYSCLPPEDISAPKYVTSTETSLKISWSAPQNLNGCPLY